MFGSAHGPHPEAKSDDVQHNERRPIHVYPDDDRRCEQGSFYHFDIPATGENPEARYTGESGSVGTPEDVDARRRQTGHNPRLAATKPDWGDRREGERAWNRGDLTVLCTEGRCQVNMGDIPVLFTAPTWGGIEHSAVAPSGLTRDKRDQFLREARHQFQTQMGQRTSRKYSYVQHNLPMGEDWGFGAETVSRFADAMKEARNQAPPAERWKLTNYQRHDEMARGALVMYEVMAALLPKYGRHPKRVSLPCQEAQAEVEITSGGAVVDGGANGVLISEATAERKGLLDRVDRTTAVTLGQADKSRKMKTYGVVQGGVSYQMMSLHGRLVTVTLPCHMARVQRDLVGGNEQGPILQGIKGVIYMELTRPDGRRGTCMIMPDGEILPLPADSRGLTMFPEIGQEKHWSKASYPLEIAELCDLLMSRERLRRLRMDMPDPASDSVLPTTNVPVAAVQQMPSNEVGGSLIEANAKPTVVPGDEAQTPEGKAPSERLSGRLTAEDFASLSDCLVCRLPRMTATWVWKKETLVDTGGVIRDWRSDPKVQRTPVCEECYEGAIRDGGLQTEEGWWMFDAEYVRSPRSFIPSFIPDGYQLKHAHPGRARQNRRKPRTPWTRVVGVAHENAEDQPLGNAEPSEPAGVSVENHIDEQLALAARLQEENLDEIDWLPADASPEWREGVKASLELEQFGWDRIVEESRENFEHEVEKRAAAEAKLNDQLESDLVSAAGQSIYEDKRDRLEQAIGPAHAATRLIVQRTQVDRRKVNGDELAERRRMAEQQEVENERKRRNLVEARRRADETVRKSVMVLIAARRARAEDSNRKNKGKDPGWETRLSKQELEKVTIQELVARAQEAGVDEVELQRTLQAGGRGAGHCSYQYSW